MQIQVAIKDYIMKFFVKFNVVTIVALGASIVWGASIEGFLFDEAGMPRADEDIWIMALANNGEPLPDDALSFGNSELDDSGNVSTKEDGYFEFTNLPHGLYRIFVSQFWLYDSCEKGEFEYLPIMVNTELMNLPLMIHPVLMRRQMLYGKFSTSAGQTLSGITVQYCPTLNPDHEKLLNRDILQRIPVADDGGFVMRCLTSGKYFLDIYVSEHNHIMVDFTLTSDDKIIFEQSYIELIEQELGLRLTFSLDDFAQ